MRSFRLFLAAVAGVAAAGVLAAQSYAPPPSQPPDAATGKEIAARLEKLGERLTALRRHNIRDPQLADVEIYHKAARWVTRHDEFYHKDAAAWTLEALDRGLLRASQLSQGEAPWYQRTGHATVRAYRSAIDGSVQPYAVTYPEGYARDFGKRWRLDVVLHGRDNGLTEVKFLHQHNGDRPARPADYVQLEIYGRGNNAYRWAGEMDVFEAVDHFLAVERVLGREQMIDLDRVVLRGFSMGGAGTWSLGLHTPDRWCVLGPGAGFTTTHGYVRGLPDKLPPYQEACLHIYDAVDYAENAFNVPVVAYGGDQDPQLQAARNIEERLKPLDVPMTLLVAPGLGHQFPAEWQQKAEAHYGKLAAKGRPEYPERVRFVTYTLKYNQCYWLNLLGLDQHYRQARVDAETREDGFAVKTENVRSLHLAVRPGSVGETTVVDIDGQRLDQRPYQAPDGSRHVYLERRDGRWALVLPERLKTAQLRRPRKSAGLQGPIDDAFTRGFVCVRGTGKPWHAATQRYAEASLQRFAAEWNKYLRGDLPVKDDTAITPEDLADRNLILFGDPASNSLIAQVIDALPLQWTKEQVKLGQQSYAAGEHVPVLIYPSPLNPQRYVVLNSGHTFHAPEFRGTNALLFPRLGDYAILKPAPAKEDPAAAEVVTAGLFDDDWQLQQR